MSTFRDPLHMLYHWEQTTPDKICMQQPINGKWHSFTWKQFAEQVRRMASALQALGYEPGSHIGLVSKNCVHWMMADLAIMMAGHVSIPLYPNIGAETIKYVMEHSGAKALFVGKLDDWKSMKPGVPEGTYCISFPQNFYGEDGYNKWEDLVAQHEPMSGNITRNKDDRMTIIYTSGTTGRPKGVVHNFSSICHAINNALTEIKIDNKGRFFSYLPLSHIAERMLVEMGCIYTGATVYFAQSLDTFAANLQHAQPTVFLAVPRIWTKFQMGVLANMPQQKLDRLTRIPIIGTIVKRKIRQKLGLDKANFCLTGAAPTPASLMKWFEKLGINIQEVYGMTENSAYSHYNRKENIRFGYVGQPMPKVDAKISDIGEILVKSEANMVGYYKQDDLTAESFEDGYLRTGDKGVIDNQGFLKITGRVKDIFKTEKGKYVSPAPIELALAKNNFIEQCCVVGLNLPQPIALMVLSEHGQKCDKEEVRQSLAATLEELNPNLEKHEKLKKAVVLKEAWTVENQLLTPTLKIKRSPIDDKFGPNYNNWYGEKGLVVWE